MHLTYCLFSLFMLNVHMDLQTLPINSAPPGGVQDLLVGNWGTGQAYDWWQWVGPGAHLLGFHCFYHPDPQHFLSETLHSALFTGNVFCINFNKLVMTSHSGNIFFFRLKSGLHLEWTCAQVGEKSFSTQDAAPVLLFSPMIIYSLSICCMTLSSFVTYVFN